MVVDRKEAHRIRNREAYRAMVRAKLYPVVDELVKFMKTSPSQEALVNFLWEHKVRVKN